MILAAPRDSEILRTSEDICGHLGQRPCREGSLTCASPDIEHIGIGRTTQDLSASLWAKLSCITHIPLSSDKRVLVHLQTTPPWSRIITQCGVLGIGTVTERR